MSDRHERNFLRWLADHERGTWREDLRSRYAPWFDGMPWGFEVGDGWRALIEQLTAEVSDIVGGPDVDPKPRVVQVKEKFGELRYYRSEEHTSELQSLMRISYAVFCFKKKILTD